MAQPNVYRIQRGQVLLAHPLLEDHNFQQSVILLADHDTQGTVGFVLNDPTEYLLPDALEGAVIELCNNLIAHGTVQVLSEDADNLGRS